MNTADVGPPARMRAPQSCRSAHKFNTYSTTTYAIYGPNMIQRRRAATATLEDLVLRS